MSKLMTARCPDYQFFEICGDGSINADTIGERMKKKLDAIHLPDLRGKSVLDVGCDFGFWSFLASNLGADRVVGLDRCRPVRGEVFDLVTSNNEVANEFPALRNCHFHQTNIGQQWENFGRFDVVFLFSLYHHIFENCESHEQIFYWLWQHLNPLGELLWENPLDVTDGVAHSNISKAKHPFYTREKILQAAGIFFDVEYIGEAKHEPTRHVFRMRPKAKPDYKGFYMGSHKAGAGGATKAFLYDGKRRIAEIKGVIGVECVAGSFNMELSEPFNFGVGYFSGTILDVADRSKGFDSPWTPREARFYPVRVDGYDCFAFRFADENYDPKFVELIAPFKICDKVNTDGKLILERR